MGEGPPDYEVLKGPKAGSHRKIISYLAQREGARARFEELARGLKSKKSSLETNLNTLVRKGFLEREGKGLYRLKYRTPLCFVANTPHVPYAYLGLLGKRERGREECETETAIGLLQKELSADFEKAFVLTTQEAIGSWQDGIGGAIRDKIRWITVSVREFNDIEAVERQVEDELLRLLKDYKLIMDCTSGVRPAGIAYYRLATRYKVPLIYVYEDRRELFWLIRDELKKGFEGILTP